MRVAAEPLEIRHLAAMESALRLLAFAQAAVSKGVLDVDQVAQWENDLRARDAAGVFACYALMFVAVGQVPNLPRM